MLNYGHKLGGVPYDYWWLGADSLSQCVGVEGSSACLWRFLVSVDEWESVKVELNVG